MDEPMEQTKYELAYQTGKEWRDYGVADSLEAARQVVKEMREQTTFQEWEIRKVTITIEIVE